MESAMTLEDQRHSVEDELINDFLWRWHKREIRTPPLLGYPGHAAGCGLYRASRQRDDENGALDADVDNIILREVGRCIERVDDPYRTALYLNARNLVSGVEVWTSPRMPPDPLERRYILIEARARFLYELKDAGIA